MKELPAVTLYRWETIEPECPQPGVIRQTVHGERQTLVRYRYAPGRFFRRMRILKSRSQLYCVDGSLCRWMAQRSSASRVMWW